MNEFSVLTQTVPVIDDMWRSINSYDQFLSMMETAMVEDFKAEAKIEIPCVWGDYSEQTTRNGPLCCQEAQIKDALRTFSIPMEAEKMIIDFASCRCKPSRMACSLET
ncbi:unnamed protein product [Symbiodinium sp. CCMP2456]|nr:unnamed protein product [Symbiodinium sp. CCMP2456]